MTDERWAEGALFGLVVPGSVRPVDDEVEVTFRWETTTAVLVTSGELTEEQEKVLLRDGDIRFVGYGEPPCKAYSQFWFVNAASAWAASLSAASRLDGFLAGYGLEYMVYHTSAHAHRDKIISERMP